MVASIPEDRPLNPSHPKAAIAAMSTRERIVAIVGSSSGNLVEWYDFYTYAFTALYFASAFFPKGDPTSQLLNTAGIFAAGFLMRPIGSWLFGRIADRHGRRTSMMLSVLMMCAGSLAIAVLPTYETIGTAAGALLLIARLVQGLSVGGEYGTSATYMSEVAARRHRGFFGSFQYVTLIGGQLLATLVVVVLEFAMSGDEIRAWGWRIPFVVGAAAAVIAFYLRRSLIETSSEDVRRSEDAGTIRALFQYPRAFLTVLGFTAGGSLIFYTYTTYMQKYLVNTAHLDTKTVSLVMAAVLFVYMVAQPAFGALSDHIGRRNNMLLFGALTTLSTVPLLGAIGTVTSPYAAFGLILCGLAAVSFYTSISGLVKAELFPMAVRALGVGLAYAISNAIFGGSAEYVALWLKNAGIEGTFAWYVTGMCAIAFVVAILMPDNRRESLIEDN